MPDWLPDLPDHSPNVPVGPYRESDFTAADARCPHPEWWTTMDAQSTENEVIEMVGGLVRGLQPDTALETGTSRGFMARAIGAALERNGHGVLHTYEPHEPTYREALATLSGVTRVMLHCEPSMSPWNNGTIDFAWFDSLTTLRAAEFAYYRQWMHAGSVVGFHDTAPRFGWRQQLVLVGGLALIDLPTPRGVTLGVVA